MTLLIGKGEGLEAPPAVPFRMQAAAKSGSGRLTAHTYCGHRDEEGELDCLERFQAGTASFSTYFCSSHGYDAETISCYDVDGKIVEVDTSALGLDSDRALQLTALVDRATIPELYVEKAQLMWAEPGAELAFDQFAAAIRVSKKVALGTAVISKATKAVIVSWDETAGTLLAQVCTHHARLALDAIDEIRELAAGREQPSDKDAKAIANGLLAERLDGEFDFATVRDEYADALEEAAQAAADGVEAPARPELAPVAPVIDLMSALQASVAKEAKPAAKRRKKTAA
jgi:non-homologous end joining protein Ku